MGIFGALTTAVGGLRAGSYALENISGNIANSQTTAFKRIDTSFLDLVPQTALTAQLAGGVTAQSRSTNSVQGDVQSASVATFMAINGNGFFAVQKPGGFTDGSDPLYNDFGFAVDLTGDRARGARHKFLGVSTGKKALGHDVPPSGLAAMGRRRTRRCRRSSSRRTSSMPTPWRAAPTRAK